MKTQAQRNEEKPTTDIDLLKAQILITDREIKETQLLYYSCKDPNQRFHWNNLIEAMRKVNETRAELILEKQLNLKKQLNNALENTAA